MTDRIISIPTSASEEARQGFDLHEALSFIWRQWKFVVAVTALICAIGVVLLFEQTPLYTANTQILLNQQNQKPPGADLILPTASYDLGVMNSQMAIIRSTAFLRRVVERNHLASDAAYARSTPVPLEAPSVWSNIASFLSSLMPNGVSFAASPRPDEGAAPAQNSSISRGGTGANELALVRSLSSGLKVSRSETDGYVVTVSFTSPDPVRAAQLANAIADAYLVDKLDARFEEAKRASSWLSDRLVSLQQQAQESEEAVASFRAQHGLTQSGNGVTLTQQQLASLNSDLISSRAEYRPAALPLMSWRTIKPKGFPILANRSVSAKIVPVRQTHGLFSLMWKMQTSPAMSSRLVVGYE